MRHILIALALATSTSANAVTRSETLDRLLCPAELVVVRADAKRLASSELEPHLATGLNNRIAAAVGTLPYLCRRYINAVTSGGNAVVPARSSDFISAIRELATLADNPAELVTRIDSLVQMAPFNIARFTINRAGDTDESAMEAVYQQYCHGCHTATDTASENPAYSLRSMANEQSDEEFYSRMLLGVRGTPEIGLSNPLTPMEIGAMARYLRTEQ